MKHNFINGIREFLIPGILAIFILSGCLSSAREYYNPGMYEGTSQGYRGTIRVLVQLSEGGIEDIYILENDEDSYALEALEELRELVLEMNSTDLDAISGATASSVGFLEAIEEAMAKSAGY